MSRGEFSEICNQRPEAHDNHLLHLRAEGQKFSPQPAASGGDTPVRSAALSAEYSTCLQRPVTISEQHKYGSFYHSKQKIRRKENPSSRGCPSRARRSCSRDACGFWRRDRQTRRCSAAAAALLCCFGPRTHNRTRSVPLRSAALPPPLRALNSREEQPRDCAAHGTSRVLPRRRTAARPNHYAGGRGVADSEPIREKRAGRRRADS